MTDRPIITALEYAERHGVSADTVQRWAKLDLLPGAYKSPNTERGTWLIPAACVAPELPKGRRARGS